MIIYREDDWQTGFAFTIEQSSIGAPLDVLGIGRDADGEPESIATIQLGMYVEERGKVAFARAVELGAQWLDYQEEMRIAIGKREEALAMLNAIQEARLGRQQ